MRHIEHLVVNKKGLQRVTVGVGEAVVEKASDNVRAHGITVANKNHAHTFYVLCMYVFYI